jgi:uncharacterized protein (DUF1330 family)
MVRLMLRNYTRLALIDTGAKEMERYRERARAAAERFGLRFEEIEGSPSLVEKLLFGPWDEECLVVPKGEVVRYEEFVHRRSMADDPQSAGAQAEAAAQAGDAR